MIAGKKLLLFLFVTFFQYFTIDIKAAQTSAEHLPGFVDITGLGSSSAEMFFDIWKVQSLSSTSAQTDYRLVADKLQGTVIQATARASVAGLTRKLEIDPQQYPFVTWSWKVSATLDMADLTRKESDDSPARLMVSFGRDYSKGGRPEGTLCYVWATDEVKGSFTLNPYSPDIMVIVVASGEEKIGTWQQYRRNLVDDYHRAFGEPPKKIRAVTLLSDTDNTGAQVDAWYGSVRFERETADP